MPRILRKVGARTCFCLSFTTEGWTVQHFLEEMKFGEGAEDVANLFESFGKSRACLHVLRHWKDFISMSARDIMRIPDISAAQRRKLDKYITLFNHGEVLSLGIHIQMGRHPPLIVVQGLWPRVSKEIYKQRFAGRPLAKEGEPWSVEDDQHLLLCIKSLAAARSKGLKWLRPGEEGGYDVNFGDPWCSCQHLGAMVR